MRVDWEALFEAAERARKAAHAPYSRFRVGSPCSRPTARVHVGCNVENASYGLTVCAERNALARMVVEGKKPRRWPFVVASRKPTPPCGACRQVMSELCPPSDGGALAHRHGQGATLHGARPAAPRLRPRRPVKKQVPRTHVASSEPARALARRVPASSSGTSGRPLRYRETERPCPSTRVACRRGGNSCLRAADRRARGVNLLWPCSTKPRTASFASLRARSPTQELLCVMLDDPHAADCSSAPTSRPSPSAPPMTGSKTPSGSPASACACSPPSSSAAASAAAGAEAAAAHAAGHRRLHAAAPARTCAAKRCTCSASAPEPPAAPRARRRGQRHRVPRRPARGLRSGHLEPRRRRRARAQPPERRPPALGQRPRPHPPAHRGRPALCIRVDRPRHRRRRRRCSPPSPREPGQPPCSPRTPSADVLLEGLSSTSASTPSSPGQAEVIASVMAGHNTVAVMPTGAGKSLATSCPPRCSTESPWSSLRSSR